MPFWNKLSRDELAGLRGQGLDVADTEIPDRDGQYRLRPCKCGSEQVIYLQLRSGGRLPWAARCMDCGVMGRERPIRHDAQLDWNTNKAQARRGGGMYHDR